MAIEALKTVNDKPDAELTPSQIDAAIEHEAGLLMRSFTEQDFGDFTYCAAPAILDAVRFDRPDVVGRIVCEVLRSAAKRIATNARHDVHELPDEDEALAKSIVLEMIPEARNVR